MFTLEHGGKNTGPLAGAVGKKKEPQVVTYLSELLRRSSSKHLHSLLV